MGKIALKKLVKNNSRGGLFITPQKSACWQSGKAKIDFLVDRPVDRRNDHIYDRRPPGRPATANGRPRGRPVPTREWGAFSQSTARSTGLYGWPCARPRAHRSTGSVDRQLIWLGLLGWKNLSF